MNVMFWVLVIILCIAIWFLLAFLFKPIGILFYKIGEDAINEITDNNKQEEETNEE